MDGRNFPGAFTCSNIAYLLPPVTRRPQVRDATSLTTPRSTAAVVHVHTLLYFEISPGEPGGLI